LVGDQWVTRYTTGGVIWPITHLTTKIVDRSPVMPIVHTADCAESPDTHKTRLLVRVGCVN